MEQYNEQHVIIIIQNVNDHQLLVRLLLNHHNHIILILIIIMNENVPDMKELMMRMNEQTIVHKRM
jgi:hypothetical protein